MSSWARWSPEAVDGAPRSLVYNFVSGLFLSDRKGVGPFTIANLRSKVRNNKDELTFMGVPPGSGQRIGVDRQFAFQLPAARRVDRIL